jgi:hypothetical protein
MKTRITTTPKRCLKFEGYLYLPRESEGFNGLRYFASKTSGHLIVYDEFGNKIQKNKKDFMFNSLGDMISHLEKIKSKIIFKRIKRK